MKHVKFLKNKKIEYEIVTWGAPVQFFGTVNGNPFYFRARYNAWKFVVTKDPNIRPESIDSEEEGFIMEEEYGQTPYKASWMPLREARKIVLACIEKYLKDARIP
ncbi:MAG: hypothetical protein HYS08_00930 [Chlamydiae bacterium]|nr:hypothetical protein [Chlamydiota bacterium]MBI3265646.1 hypothetical protein [Chlamydiota bacterium]